jgi:hypothetical protein
MNEVMTEPADANPNKWDFYSDEQRCAAIETDAAERRRSIEAECNARKAEAREKTAQIEAQARVAILQAEAPTSWIKHVVWAIALTAMAWGFYYARMNGMQP